ncbi:MAG: prepilin-type N-terminal cleavage/methylation domain-containing protein [Fimbriimonadaceae bacterium]|nr:prepilin-type N-terminal cleavage/methylation domain-containing protein [Fimbriimonadaceae bacterium]
MVTIKKTRKGFTLVELLVTVLILAVLMAVALPLYLSAVADSEKKTARSNMQTIANAVQAWKIKSGSAYAAIASPVSATLTDLQNEPICPRGGTYFVDLSNAPFTVHCTIADFEEADGPCGAGYTPGCDGS